MLHDSVDQVIERRVVDLHPELLGHQPVEIVDGDRLVGSDVPLLGQVPLDPRLRESGDAGVPLVLSDPEAPAAVVLRGVADRLSTRSRGLAGRLLSVSPAGR